MAAAPRILIVGGSGVFGQRLAHELLRTTAAEIVVAGRDRGRAEAACRRLGAPGRVTPSVVDLRQPAALARAAAGCLAVACTAGPFQQLPRGLPAAAVAAGAHWLDIADAAAWVLPLLRDRPLDRTAQAANLVVIPGLSSVPALSGLLARRGLERLPGAIGGRLTLYIGNRNAKGAGAIASVLAGGLGRAVSVELPIGRRPAYRASSPDEVLLAPLGLHAEFRVAFESPLTGPLLGLFAPVARRLAPAGRIRLARALAVLSRPTGRFGSDVGCLQAELWDAGGQRVRAALLARGQRLAILPCALAIEALLAGELSAWGVLEPAGWLAPLDWAARLRDRGVELLIA